MKSHCNNGEKKSDLFHEPVSHLRCIFSVHMELKSKISAMLISIGWPDLE